jgi:hypothetical protein
MQVSVHKGPGTPVFANVFEYAQWNSITAWGNQGDGYRRRLNLRPFFMS